MRTVGLIVVAVALVCVAVWFGWFALSGTDPAPIDEVEAQSSAEPDPALDPAPDAVTVDPDVVPEREIEATPDLDSAVRSELEPVPSAHPTPSGDHAMIVGRFVIVDADEVEHHHTNGSFLPMLGTERSAMGGDEVSVKDGRFVVAVLDGKGLGIWKPRLEDRPVVLDTAFFEITDALIDQSEELIVHGRWPTPCRLRVVDRESGIDLDRITVIRASGWPMNHPFPARWTSQQELATEVRSPFDLITDNPDDLSHRRGKSNLLVGAAGRAWAPLQVDFREGGEYTVELGPGASLEVVVEGTLPPAKTGGRSFGRSRVSSNSPRLRLRLAEAPVDEMPSLDDFIKQMETVDASMFPGGVRPSEEEIRNEYAKVLEFVERARGDVVLEDAARIGTTTWEGLAPGTYVVAVELGSHWEDPLVMGEVPCELEAGQVHRVTLNVTPPPQGPEPVPLAGTLFLPPSWSLQYLSLRFEPLDLVGRGDADEVDISLGAMTRTGTPGLYRWSAGRVAPGRYIVTIYSLEYQQMVDTGPGGREDVEIVIGKPADVTLKVVSAATGLAVPGLEVHWNCRRPQESTGGSLGSLDWDEATQTYGFRAPAGEIELSLWDDRFGWVNREQGHVTLEPGPNALHFEVRRLSGAVLVLRSGDEAVSVDWKWTWSIEIEAVGHDGSGAVARSSRNQVRFIMDRAGRYRITMEAPDGFQAISPFEIDVPDGEFVEHELQVRRQ